MVERNGNTPSKPPVHMPASAERRRPRTFWLTDSEFARVTRLARVKDDLAVGRKALMLGVSIIETGLGGEASMAGAR